MTETFEQARKRFDKDPEALVAYAHEQADAYRDDKLAAMAESKMYPGRVMSMTAIIGHSASVTRTLYKYKGESPDMWAKDFVNEVAGILCEHIAESIRAAGFEKDRFGQEMVDSCGNASTVFATALSYSMVQALVQMGVVKPN